MGQDSLEHAITTSQLHNTTKNLGRKLTDGYTD